MRNIFLSYSRKDTAAARRLHAALGARDREVWIDWDDIPPSVAWWNEIRAAIEGADAVLVMMSPDSMTSTVCAEELAHASALQKRLLPLVVRDVPADDVPPALRSLNWIFLRDADDFGAGIERLLVAVDTDFEWLESHTRLLVRAGDWERHGQDSSYLLRGADLESAERWRSNAADKQPPPAAVHDAFLGASRHAEAAEIERLRGLYRSALARQLAAQAALIQRETDALLDRSMLLAAQSVRRVPTAEADRALRDGLRLRAVRIAGWNQQGLPTAISAAPGAHWVATAGESENTVEIRDARDGRLARTAAVPGEVGSTVFLPGADAVVALAAGSLIRVDVDGRTPRAIGQHFSARSLCALPSGAAVVSVGPGGAICHAANGSGVVWTLELEPEAWVAAADSSGRLVAIGASDCVIRVVDAATGELRRSLAHDTTRPVMRLERGTSDAGVVALEFGGDPLRLASGGLDGTVRVWDMTDGRELHRGSHDRDVLCVAFHGGRGLVASGGLDRQLRVWPAAGGAELARLPHQAAVTSAAWSEDGRWLATACGDGCARLWHIADDGRASEISRETLPTWAGCVVMAGDSQIAAGDDGTVVIFGAGAPSDRGVDHPYSISGAVCSDDGRRVLVRIDDPTLIAYDVAAGWGWKTLQQPDFSDWACYTRDGALIVTNWDGGVREYDAATLELRHTQMHPRRVWNAQVAHDQQSIATAVQDEPVLRLWRRGGPEPFRILGHDAHVRSIDFSPGDERLATGCDDGSVRAWDLSLEEVRWEYRHQGKVWSVAFDPSGRRVASVADDCVLVVTDAFSGEGLHRVPLAGKGDDVAFSPDGRWLALRHSFAGPHLVLVWSVPSMTLHAEFPHEDQVAVMVWSADSTRLATAGAEGVARVFDVATGVEQVRLTLGGWCGSVVWVPETQDLLTASNNGALRLTTVHPARMVELAEARVPRVLVDAEWRRYLPDEPRPEPPTIQRLGR